MPKGYPDSFLAFLQDHQVLLILQTFKNNLNYITTISDWLRWVIIIREETDNIELTNDLIVPVDKMMLRKLMISKLIERREKTSRSTDWYALHNNHKNKEEKADKKAKVVRLQEYLIFVSYALPNPFTMMTEAFTAQVAFRAVIN